MPRFTLPMTIGMLAIGTCQIAAAQVSPTQPTGAGLAAGPAGLPTQATGRPREPGVPQPPVAKPQKPRLPAAVRPETEEPRDGDETEKPDVPRDAVTAGPSETPETK